MAGIQGIIAGVGVLGYMFAGAVLGLVIFSIIGLIEHARGRPFVAGAQAKMDRRIVLFGHKLHTWYMHATHLGRHLPGHIVMHVLHILASLGLRLVHLAERFLHRAIRAVRGKRELAFGRTPSSPYFEHIVPGHKRPATTGSRREVVDTDTPG